MNWTTLNGVQVQYGDLCVVDVFDGSQYRMMSVRFVDRSDDGDNWFECLNPEESVRGDSTFPDYYAEVGDARFVSRPDNPSLYIADGI